jgi:hypothetical protein
MAITLGNCNDDDEDNGGTIAGKLVVPVCNLIPSKELKTRALLDVLSLTPLLSLLALTTVEVEESEVVKETYMQ